MLLSAKTSERAEHKYKFVPGVELAYELRPGKDGYLFLEGDTYVSWPTLNRWFDMLDPTRRLHIGNAIQKSPDREPVFFAHGGSGFILPGPVVKEFAINHYGITTKLEVRMQD